MIIFEKNVLRDIYTQGLDSTYILRPHKHTDLDLHKHTDLLNYRVWQ